MVCRSHENVADLLGISRLEADGPPAPLYPPGNPLPLHTSINVCSVLLLLLLTVNCFGLHGTAKYRIYSLGGIEELQWLTTLP